LSLCGYWNSSIIVDILSRFAFTFHFYRRPSQTQNIPVAETAGVGDCDFFANLEYIVSRHRFGLHGMKGEHFGIAPAELICGGCITFVPDDGVRQKMTT
jgi:hypothetical protein